MDRCGLFVDAGYLYAAGGELCCGERKRSMFDLDVAGFVTALTDAVTDDCDLPLLRVYWYDGAKRRIPTRFQQDVAAVANVKLRLGSMNGRNQQKGVDALIYRDLITLARERSIAHAYLVSGDEDLREGVQSAQELGVRVTLVGIEPVAQQYNQSRDLVNEADHVIQMDKKVLGPFFTSRQQATAAASPGDAATPAPARPPDAERTARQAGVAFAQAWREQASDEQLSALVADRPKIPAPMDVELLRAVERAVGIPIRHHDDVRRAGRRGFWQAMNP